MCSESKNPQAYKWCWEPTRTEPRKLDMLPYFSLGVNMSFFNLRLPEVGLLNTNDFLMVEMYVIRMQDVIGKQWRWLCTWIFVKIILTLTCSRPKLGDCFCHCTMEHDLGFHMQKSSNHSQITSNYYGLIVVTLLQKTEISAMFNPKKQQHLMLHQHLGISFDQRCRSIEVYKIVKRHFGQVIRWAEPAEYRKPLMGIYYISILYLLGGGFKHFLFSPLFGEDFHFDIFWLIFFKGVETTSQ